MLTSKDLGGLMAMMPAFATDDAADVRATATVDVGRLHHGLDCMIRDGANVIATTGSFGECQPADVLSEESGAFQMADGDVQGGRLAVSTRRTGRMPRSTR